ncbi:MAG: DNA polymerase IV [Clostridia bacterium]|nr:DNA polymerase IV [Clostridia bacterium]
MTGEPICFAKKKCPNLQIFPGDFTVYREYSNKLYNLLLEYTDIIERFSIDECFLDMTGFLMGRTLEDVAKEINNRVRNELKFTVNIGIAHNKLLAKMASDFEKPDKIHTLYENEIEKKMWTLPASELFMLGRKTVPKLLNMQIKTIGDVAKTDKEILVRKFGKHGQMMWEYANGIDNSPVNNVKELPKSIGNSVTLARDLKSIDEINPILVALVEKVTYRLRKYQMLADVINVQLRTNNFIDYSHQKKLAYSTSSTKDILKLAKEILANMYNGEPIRLIGVRVDNLTKEDEIQLSFFSNDNSKQNNLDKTLDNITNKYGISSITRASKLNVDINYKENQDNKKRI